MALEALSELKSKKAEAKNIIFKKHLVLGLNPYTASTYLFLREKYGKENVLLLSQSPYSDEDLEVFGPNTVRGQECRKVLSAINGDIEEDQAEAIFYKELKFRSFGSKAKPEPLLEGEEYFVSKRAKLNERDYFKFSDEQKEIIKEELVFSLVKAVDKTEPTDLIDKDEWQIETPAKDIYTCEYLYSGMNPNVFYRLMNHKERMSDQFVEYCEQTSGKAALFIRVKYNEEICDRLETLFLPLSYTHEWGHFIGEFEVFDEKTSTQGGEFVTFVDEDQSSEEEISRKIRYLKKNLKKIFYPESNVEPEIFIKFVDNYTCQKLDDSLFYSEQEAGRNLFFVGTHAPLASELGEKPSCEDSLGSVLYTTRALLSMKQVENFSAQKH